MQLSSQANFESPPLTPTLQVLQTRRCLRLHVANMSDTVAADDDGVTLPHIPAGLYKIVAQYVDADDLPALRLASKSWHGAATAAGW